MNSRIFSGFYVFRTSNAPRGIVQHFLEVGLFSNTSPSVFFPPKGEIALGSSRSSSHLSFDSFSEDDQTTKNRDKFTRWEFKDLKDFFL